MALGSLCLDNARGDTGLIKCYICQLFHRDNEEGGDSWRAVKESTGEEAVETSGGETMLQGGLFEEKIAEASQGKKKEEKGVDR